jgi:hypothetical protein
VRIRLIGLSLLAGIIFPASSALAAGSNGIGVRLVDIRAGSSDNPRAASYIVERLAPGARISRRVEITNTTHSAAVVSIYPAGAGLHLGAFGFAPGHTRNELSSWTAVSRAVLRLAPGTKAFETVTVDVPKDASSGERYAVIWAEVSAPAPAGGGVTLVNRVGVRMYLSVGPGGAPPANFAIGPLAAERSATGAPLVVAKIHNSGRRTLDVNGNVTLSNGPSGLRAGPFLVKLSALAPGTSMPAIVRLDKRLPRGPWRVDMRLSSGFVERAAVKTMTFPRYGTAARPPVVTATPSGSGRLILAAIGLSVLLAAAAVALLHARRGRQGRGGIGPAATT